MTAAPAHGIVSDLLLFQRTVTTLAVTLAEFDNPDKAMDAIKAKLEQHRDRVEGMPELPTIRYTGARKVLMEAVKVGKRGTIIVPAKLLKRYGIVEGMLVTTEAREDGVLIRPAVVLPVEKYAPER